MSESESAVEASFESLLREGLLVAHQPLMRANELKIGSVYALTRRGYRAAGESCVHPLRRSSLTVAHDVLRNDLGVVLELLDRRGLLRLLEWQTARSHLADAVWLLERNHAVRVPLVADALAVVDAGDGPSTLLVETDRGTVSEKRMALRYRGYQSWWQGGGPLRRFGSKRLRVLTLVPDEPRLDRLRIEALRATGGRGSGLFWFAVQAVADVRQPQSLLEVMWRTAQPDDAVVRPLFRDFRMHIDSGAVPPT